MADRATDLARKIKPIVMKWINESAGTAGGGGGASLTVNDHGALGGLSDYDHDQYARADATFLTLSLSSNLTNERSFGVGDGLDESDLGAGSTYTVSVDVTDFIDTAYGLTETSNNIQINEGAGLEFSGGALVVNPGIGLTLTGDEVVLGATTTIDLTTDNTPTGTTHAHAITTSSNPGGAAAILATSSAGSLQLLRLGIGEAGNTDNWIQMTDGGGIGDATGLRIVFDETASSFDYYGGDILFSDATVIATTSGDLSFTPGGNVELTTGSLKTDHWVSQTTGWGITYAGAGDFQILTANELHVKAFTAEIYQALIGALIITKSRAKLSRDFTIPATSGTNTLYVEDLEGWEGVQLFSASDYVLLRHIDMSGGGLVVADVWGQVTVYADEGGGEQSYTFTCTDDGGVSTEVIYTGAIALDYGASGDGVWSATVLDAAGAPYSQVTTWTTNPWTPGNFTAHTRLGELTGLGFTGEYGLYAGQDTNYTYLLLTDTSFEGHGLDLKLYQSTTNTIWLDSSTPAVIIGSGAATDTFSSGNGIWMGNDSGTYKFRVGNTATAYINWDGTYARVYAGPGDYLQCHGDSVRIYSDTVNWFTIENQFVTVGNNAGGEYVTVSSTGITFWGGGDQHGAITSAGAFWFGEDSTHESIAWDSTNGLSIYGHTAKIVSFPISGDAQIVGTLDVTSPGVITAGTGVLLLNADGIEIVATTAYQDIRAYRIVDTAGGEILASYKSYRVSGSHVYTTLGSYARNVAGEDAYLVLEADSQYASTTASIQIMCYPDGNQSARIMMTGLTSTTGYIGMYDASVFIGPSGSSSWKAGAAGYLGVEYDGYFGTGLVVGSINATTYNPTGGALFVLGGISTDTTAPAGELRWLSGDIVTNYGIAVGNQSNNPNSAQIFVGTNTINNTSFQSYGITINQGDSDNEILTFQSSDVGQLMTAVAQTQTYGTFSKYAAANGGLAMTGLTETYIAIMNYANYTTGVTTKTTSSLGAYMVNTWKRNSTSTVSPSTNENMFIVKAGSNNRFIIDADGDIFYGGSDDGSITADAYDDVQLARAFDHVRAPKQVIRNEFDDWVQYNEKDLVDIGILGAPKADGGLTCLTGLVEMHNGAIWQLATKIYRMVDALEELGFDREQLLGENPT